jgi:hypothetical protein
MVGLSEEIEWEISSAFRLPAYPTIQLSDYCQWQLAVPASVKVLPATGMNLQS